MIGYTRPIKFILLYFYWFISSIILCMRAATVARIAGRVVSRRLDSEQEVKRLDLTGNLAGGVPSTWAGLLLNLTSLGTDSFNRLGIVIRAKHLALHFRLTQNPAAVTANNTTLVRCILLLDTMPMGAAPVFAGTTSAPMDQNNLESLRNRLQTQRYVILKDRHYRLTPGSQTALLLNWNVRLRFRTHYMANGGTYADMAQNALYFLTISNEGTNTPVLNYASRFRFTDD